MIDFLRNWITNIAVVMIFITLLDTLLPSGDMRRYTKVISGLIIILVIIKPLLMIKDIDYQFKMSMVQTTAYLDENIDSKGKELGEYQKAQAMELYEDNIIAQLKSVISASNSISKDDINIKMKISNDSTDKNYGEIESMVITIQGSANTAISVSKVESVKISSDKNVIKENNVEYNLNDSSLSQDIKTSVHNYIGIKEESIIVKIQ